MRIIQRPVKCFAIACVLVTALLLVVSGVRSAGAGGAVADCSNDTQLSNLLAGGGTITFNCGAAPRTILITSQKSINAPTTIDGGGKITLDGQDTYRLFDVGASLTLRNIVLTRAYFNGDGGAIINRSNGTLILENSVIRDSRAEVSGGAILSFGPMTITNSLLENNQALNGGALYPRWSGAQTTIINSVLRSNKATDTTNGWGGAILAFDGAPVTIEDSSIYNNTANFGGGVFNYYGTVTMTSVTISSNSATITGGGIGNYGAATLTNATLSSNSATNGGGLYTWDGTATLTNVTLAVNTASANGGGIYRFGGSVDIKNTIVANSSPSGENCVGDVTDDGYNLSSDNSCGLTVTYEPNLMLGLLAANGGPTLTHMPQPGSRTIDFVTAGCPPPSTDQRGARRPYNGTGIGTALCDAGAVEYKSPVSVAYLPLTLKDYLAYFEGPWEVEPNNTIGQANGPLHSGRAYHGYPGQVFNNTRDSTDYFSIYLKTTGTITVTVTDFHAAGDLVLRDSSRNEKARWGGSGGTMMNVTATGLPSAWYYIQVYVDISKTVDSTIAYALTATFP